MATTPPADVPIIPPVVSASAPADPGTSAPATTQAPTQARTLIPTCLEQRFQDGRTATAESSLTDTAAGSQHRSRTQRRRDQRTRSRGVEGHQDARELLQARERERLSKLLQDQLDLTREIERLQNR